MRLFLDTNVLVSAFATRGLSADVLRLALAEHELITAEVVLDELERVLRHKIGAPEPVFSDAVSLLRSHHVEPDSVPEPDVPVRDPDDARVLASAMAAKAEILVTGDRDLLELQSDVTRPRILSPRAFWEELRP